jgi:CRISPR-associated protein Cmr2
LIAEGNEVFYRPNPGLLYPAVHDLAERTIGAAKALRPFEQLRQVGYRCTVTGEHEVLTATPPTRSDPRQSREGSVWTRLEGRFGIKPRERLGAIATLKRLWPTLFTERVRNYLDVDDDQRLRYVVSTHTMALATSMGAVLERDRSFEQKLATLSQARRLADLPRVALPRSLHRMALDRGAVVADRLARLPSLLDGDEGLDDASEGRCALRALFDGVAPETYYALLQMDGDRMGAWMAGNEPAYQRSFESSWHPQVRESVRRRFGGSVQMREYMGAARPMSPARHAAISAVLNNFSTHVARHILEDVFKGKLLYAGGDDVLAMVSVDDLLPAMLLLRMAWSGLDGFDSIPGLADTRLARLRLAKGYAMLDRRIMPMMGSMATASIGAVIAHHQAPLSVVLRELREAEQRAKHHGRNAFSLRLLKRAGGSTEATCRFWEQTPSAGTGSPAVAALLGFAQELAREGVSRRAVYNALRWIADLPARSAQNDASWREMTASSLAHQFKRQKVDKERAHDFAHRFVELACLNSETPEATGDTLGRLLVVSEFLARESRMREATT